jgi:sec-independent protein translocase protein TatA
VFNIGPTELIVILLIALIVFGPKRLPEVGRTIGKSLREFRQATSDIKDELNLGLDEDEDEDEQPKSGSAKAPPAGQPSLNGEAADTEGSETAETGSAT